MWKKLLALLCASLVLRLGELSAATAPREALREQIAEVPFGQKIEVKLNGKWRSVTGRLQSLTNEGFELRQGDRVRTFSYSEVKSVKQYGVVTAADAVLVGIIAGVLVVVAIIAKSARK